MAKKKISKDIKYDPKNARIHGDKNKEVINTSLKENGLGRSILLDREGYIIAGNGVFEQAKNENIPVEIIEIKGDKLIALQRVDLDFNSKERKNMAIADNAASDSSSFNYEAFQDEYYEEVDFEKWGVDQPEAERVEAEDDGFTPNTDIKSDVVTGDLIEFEIGKLKHRLICGSSSDSDLVEKIVGNGKIDLVLTDPPYGVSYVGKTEEALTIQNDNLSEEETKEIWQGAFNSMFPFLKKGGSIYATVPAGPLQTIFTDVMKDADSLRQILTWNKDSMVLGRSDYHYKHEPILYGWKPGARHYFTKDRTKTSVLDFARPKASREHPTMKPIPLWIELINNSSRPGWTVYDPFMGSGTTMVASHLAKRNSMGFEIDPIYCQVIINRMMQLEESIKVKINGKIYSP